MFLYFLSVENSKRKGEKLPTPLNWLGALYCLRGLCPFDSILENREDDTLQKVYLFIAVTVLRMESLE